MAAGANRAAPVSPGGHAGGFRRPASRGPRPLPPDPRPRGALEQFLRVSLSGGGPPRDRVHLCRRRFPGEPCAAAAGPRRGRFRGTLPAAAKAEPGPVRRLFRPGRVPNRQRLAGAVSAGCGPAGRDPADQGHPAPHSAPEADLFAGDELLGKREGAGRKRDDRRPAAQRPLPRLPAGKRPRQPALPLGKLPLRATPGLGRPRHAARGPRADRACCGPRFPAAR